MKGRLDSWEEELEHSGELKVMIDTYIVLILEWACPSCECELFAKTNVNNITKVGKLVLAYVAFCICNHVAFLDIIFTFKTVP